MKDLKSSLGDFRKIDIFKVNYDTSDTLKDEYIVTDYIYKALAEILKYLTDDLIFNEENISIRYCHKNAIVLYIEFGYERANLDLIDKDSSITSRLWRNGDNGIIKIDHDNINNDRYNPIKKSIKDELIKIHELTDSEKYLNYLLQDVGDLNLIKKLLDCNTPDNTDQRSKNLLKRLNSILSSSQKM